MSSKQWRAWIRWRRLILCRMPSGGLIDQPQDSKFYDYHLRDPIDKPFATFKFHYRSWENLVALQLIPVDHPEQLFQQSPTALSLYGITVELESRVSAPETPSYHQSYQNSLCTWIFGLRCGPFILSTSCTSVSSAA